MNNNTNPHDNTQVPASSESYLAHYEYEDHVSAPASILLDRTLSLQAVWLLSYVHTTENVRHPTRIEIGELGIGKHRRMKIRDELMASELVQRVDGIGYRLTHKGMFAGRSGRRVPLPYRLILDEDISQEARGLAIVLSCWRAGWTASIREVQEYMQVGRDKMRGLMGELVEKGYMVLRRGGESGGSTYTQGNALSLFKVTENGQINPFKAGHLNRPPENQHPPESDPLKISTPPGRPPEIQHPRPPENVHPRPPENVHHLEGAPYKENIIYNLSSLEGLSKPQEGAKDDDDDGWKDFTWLQGGDSIHAPVSRDAYRRWLESDRSVVAAHKLICQIMLLHELAIPQLTMQSILDTYPMPVIIAAGYKTRANIQAEKASGKIGYLQSTITSFIEAGKQRQRQGVRPELKPWKPADDVRRGTPTRIGELVGAPEQEEQEATLADYQAMLAWTSGPMREQALRKIQELQATQSA